MKIFNRGKKEQPTEKPQTMNTGSGPQPDYRQGLMVVGGDAKGHALNKLLSSDASNAIKSSNSNPFNLAVMDAISYWEMMDSEDELLQVFLNGRTLEQHGSMEGGYRIDKMAEDFKMTMEYVEGFKAWTLLGSPGASAPPSQLTEGNKTK